MRVIVCGGRNYHQPGHVFQSLKRLHGILPITAVMQGGGTGVDAIARQWAWTHKNIERFVCHANWTRYGKAAGPIRNARMLEWKPDLVVAFPGSVGTNDMRVKTVNAGFDLLTYNENGGCYFTTSKKRVSFDIVADGVYEMNDEGWDTLPPAVRTEVFRRGEEALGQGVYSMPKDLFYSFVDRALINIEKASSGERMEQGAAEYEEIERASKLMGG